MLPRPIERQVRIPHLELLLETIKNSADTIDSLRESRIEFVRLDSGSFREKDCSRTCQATNA